MDNKSIPPDPKNEDAHIEALTNAVITSFLGSVVSEFEMSEAAKALEYLLYCFTTGPHPLIRDWFINELAYYPLIRMRITILTYQNVKHQIVLQVDQKSMIRLPEEGENEDEDTA